MEEGRGEVETHKKHVGKWEGDHEKVHMRRRRNGEIKILEIFEYVLCK